MSNEHEHNSHEHSSTQDIAEAVLPPAVLVGAVSADVISGGAESTRAIINQATAMGGDLTLAGVDAWNAEGFKRRALMVSFVGAAATASWLTRGQFDEWITESKGLKGGAIFAAESSFVPAVSLAMARWGIEFGHTHEVARFRFLGRAAGFVATWGAALAFHKQIGDGSAVAKGVIGELDCWAATVGSVTGFVKKRRA